MLALEVDYELGRAAHSTGQSESHAFISSSEQGLSSQNHRCTLIPGLMPMLDEK
jgi:hypothetical protein